jgi:hypothetical protein
MGILILVLVELDSTFEEKLLGMGVCFRDFGSLVGVRSSLGRVWSGAIAKHHPAGESGVGDKGASSAKFMKCFYP